ncbi:MAG TPA: 2-oxo acid dehydrogenase subunit E2 [Fimbriimonadaceae bacterium]|nr:2-oxo acid dehydrogenase subunit E2 [Fimbriimonadaceae bacterium]HRJ32367.1 2-oxo acid dehydrogenase subunit E2 [Fimbriimonadaceae bacterium]
MKVVPLRIPQIGEGLQEARLVAVLKQPGDRVKRDEPIYQMETDKAVMDVESPYEGVLERWVVPVDTILPIGGEVGMMQVEDSVVEVPAGHGPPPASSATPVPVTPSASAASGEKSVPLRIPQIGEGLQEARLVAVLKQPGDKIKRDDAIYQMETDKAVMDVESPYEGVLERWSVPVDTVLAIGAEVGVMRVAGEVREVPAGHGPPPPPSATPTPSAPAQAVPGAPAARRTDIPPRTRAYAKEKGLSEADLASIPARGSKLMPEDVDAFLAGGGVGAPVATAPTVSGPTRGTSPSGAAFEEVPLSQKQRLLSSRLVRGSQLVVPGTIVVPAEWTAMENLKAHMKAQGGDFQPSSFTIFAYAVAQALKNHPGFRSTMIGDSSIRTFDHAELGIAVALPGDELVLAVVNKADSLDFKTFGENTRARIEEARSGKDQANEATTISLTNMQAFGLRDAVPVVVPPGVATLFLGEVYNGLANNTSLIELKRFVNLSLTFDHRLINGVGAAEFLNEVKRNIETIGSLVGV